MLISQDYANLLARLLVDEKLILFVGAGISLQARSKSLPRRRLPLWGELAKLVANKTDEKLESYGGDLFDLFDSIARKHDRVTLEDAIRAAIPEDDFEPGPVHQLIAELPWRRVYTTNYDNLLARAFGEKYPIVSEQDYEFLARPPSQQPKLIHLHGTLANMHTLTGEDYQRWSHHHPKAHNRLVVDGTEAAFLFMGYSNSDPHFKHFILPMIKDLKADRGHRNHSWMWQPSSDQIALFRDRDKVEVHPIEEDDDWRKCLDILRATVFGYQSPKLRGSSRNSRATEKNPQVDKPVRINGYKLFYYRDIKSMSRYMLARRSGLTPSRITRLEVVNTKRELGPECFKTCTAAELQALERVLKPDAKLEYGEGDDFLAFFIEYYKNNWRKPRAKKVPQPQHRTLFSTRAVVFDFGGTLTLPQFKENTWERIWKSVGFTLTESNELHHRFSAGQISHQQWCDLTCEKLRAAGFSISHFESVCSDIRPIEGLKETFETLRSRRIAIHIVSGSLRTIIEKVLNGAARFVDSIRSNDMQFDKDDKLERIIGHPYDFEGKADFIEQVAHDLNCDTMSVLFVGNSLNDEKAALSGARTLCVNPKHTHYYETSMWNYTIREMTNLTQILPFV